MSYLTKDAVSGKKCAAKSAFILTLGVFLVKILLSGMTVAGVVFEPVNYLGMSAFLMPLGGVYFGRSYLKAKA